MDVAVHMVVKRAVDAALGVAVAADAAVGGRHTGEGGKTN